MKNELTLADGFGFDLIRILEDRGLLTAASGAGKSWALRRLLEQAAPHVQILVLDPEGEFASLREKFELLVCAPSGADAAATPETAPLLVRFLLESGVSAVLDIYELGEEDRQEFVRRFCKALVDAPKTLWKQVLIVLDEAHVYCPEGTKSACGKAVIDLATRGRKRGFGLVMATQRLAALNKNAAAQALNKLIGKCGIDRDIKRAADELGWSSSSTAAQLRDLKRGEFFIYGPAFADGVHRIKVGPVQTSHPEPGKRALEAPPKPSPKLQKLLSERLRDLPQQAEKEAMTIEELEDKIRQLDGELSAALSSAGGIGEEEIQRRIREAIGKARVEAFADAGVQVGKAKSDLLSELRTFFSSFEQKIEELVVSPTYSYPVEEIVNAKYPPPETPPHQPAVGKMRAPRRGGGDAHLKRGAREILGQLASVYPNRWKRQEVSLLVGMNSNSGTFSDYLSKLRSLGLIEDVGKDLVATKAGLDWLGHDRPARYRSPQEALALWTPQLKAGARRMLEALIKDPAGLSRAALGQAVGMENSGTFSDYLSKLKRSSLIYQNGDGWRASPLLIGRR